MQPTSGTYGRVGSVSSASESLQSFLANRLRLRLGIDGSTRFPTIWKDKVTPLGRRYCQLAPSVRRTSAAGYGLLPTPAAQSYGSNQGGRWTSGTGSALAGVDGEARSHELGLEIGIEGHAGQCKAAIGRSWSWPPESGFRRVAHGIPARGAKLRALGNAIVPQVAAEFILAYEDTPTP